MARFAGELRDHPVPASVVALTVYIAVNATTVCGALLGPDGAYFGSSPRMLS
jgi:hypothetical protein